MSAAMPPDAELKILARVLIERVGGLDAAAAATRVGRAQLSNYQSLNHDQIMPADVAARLEALVGEPIITAALARRAGYDLVRREPMSGAELDAAMARLATEFGEAFSSYAQAKADGRLCATEIANMQREVADVVRIAHSVLSALATTQPQV